MWIKQRSHWACNLSSSARWNRSSSGKPILFADPSTELLAYLAGSQNICNVITHCCCCVKRKQMIPFCAIVSHIKGQRERDFFELLERFGKMFNCLFTDSLNERFTVSDLICCIRFHYVRNADFHYVTAN